ncbi:MAG: hypothetical protein JO102_07380 [Elusimicrobia bacterium]|nr:hypothetical protein [Elusimicrobiota bacterium]
MRNRKRGSGVVEYILITALVSLAAVAIFKTFRTDVAEAYQRTGETLLNSVQEDVAPAP